MSQPDNPEYDPKLIELISKEDVTKRIDELAIEVVERYSGTNPLFVAFLMGALPFASRLMTAVADYDDSFHPVMDAMIISTYKNEHVAQEPRIVTDLSPDTQVSGRTVVMLDDLRDTGATSAFADAHFRARGATQVDFITLVLKENPDALYRDPDLYGFGCPKEHWLVGMGMDNSKYRQESHRWMGSVAIFQPEQ